MQKKIRTHGVRNKGERRGTHMHVMENKMREMKVCVREKRFTHVLCEYTQHRECKKNTGREREEIKGAKVGNCVSTHHVLGAQNGAKMKN